jgi:peptidyl-prolyl cis-trans isomerase D
MPFETFRRNQRPLLAVFALMAMFAFVVSDSLINFISGNGSGANKDEVVVQLFGKDVKASEIGEMASQRAYANDFLTRLLLLKLSKAQMGLPPIQNFFGPTDDKSIVDAMILDKEADRLGMPIDAEATRKWLRESPVSILLQSFGLSGSETTMRTFADRIGSITNADLDETYQSFFATRIPDQALMDAIGNQLRILQVQRLGVNAEISPLEVYEQYRKEAEAVSVNAVAFPVDAYLPQTGEPTEADLKALFEKGSQTEPKRTLAAPAFKISRKVQVEAVSADINAITAKLTAEMKEERVKEEYESRKEADFTLPPYTPEERLKLSPLPQDLFAGDTDAKMTPKGPADSQVPPAPAEGTRFRPFEEVKTSITEELAREDATSLVESKFAQIRDGVMNPFADKILDIQEENEAAIEEGRPGNTPLPKYDSAALVDAVKKLELTYEKTNLISEDEATSPEAVASLGVIVDARVGTEVGDLGNNFTTEIFSEDFEKFDPSVFSTISGRRYIVWKIDDQPARVPTFEEAKTAVTSYWKTAKAREMAEKAAKEFAAAVDKKAGDLNAEATATKKTVIVTAPTTRQATSFGGMPSRANQFPELVEPGEGLMNAAFELKEKVASVVPNSTTSIYYVMTVNSRKGISPEQLYGAGGPFLRLLGSAMSDTMGESRDEWLKDLRRKAKLPENWVPPSEQNRNSKSNS